ncbi:hypothetical protein F5Y12DRAFT_785629 [Xylaria sp. FL1777]|nr:hypothetical protein F5Y12DRAFT_785629 [Xylaria sp. FL1777]
MMFLGTTRKAAEIQPEQKWDAISLRDFKSSSVFTWSAYGYLYFSIILSLAVYGVDIFTAINLLAFNQWSSSIEPTQLLTFDETKWIFAGTIIASFVNLIFEHFRAWRVMKRGSVAECYLDTLAVRLESTRIGKGQGWRRFLVFAELTKSKKGAEYVALFSYFSLQSWIRVLVCSGPRQSVNALTLYGVYTLNLTPTDDSSFESTIGGFFSNIRALAAENTQQAVILSGMLFTLVIWVFSFLFLLLGILFYVFFLWHYIPRQDGGLHGYCERKVNKRLKAIVTKKINKALAKEDLKRAQAHGKAANSTGEQSTLDRQATLPSFMDVEKGDALAEMPMLNRNDTMATLPVYSSRPGTPGSIELGLLDQKRPLPVRQATNGTSASANNYSSRAPLVAGAAEMGFDRSASPTPTIPNVELNNYQGPLRVGTQGLNGTFNREPLMNGLRSPDTLQSMPERVRSPVSGPDGFNGLSSYSANERQMPNRPPYNEGRSIAGPSMYANRGPRSSPAPSGYQTSGPGYPPARTIMATLTVLHSQWHPGEQAVHRMLGVTDRDNPTIHGLRQAHGYRVSVSPLVAFGTLDEHGRPWATIWGGEAGFCRPIAENVLGVNGTADARFDPVMQALFAVHSDEEKSDAGESRLGFRGRHIVDEDVVKPTERKVMAALAIDLETRDRVKLAGRFIAGSAVGTAPGVANLQMAFAVEEALGNCPKYLNKKHIVPHVPTPELVLGADSSADDGIPLPREAVELIAKADLFFIARFLRVFRNQGSKINGDGADDGGVVLIYPEYSGNRLYQTLGNLNEDPVAGLVIPDFNTGDVLYLTGRTTTLLAERAAAYMPHAKLAVRIDVTEARFVRAGLPFRGTVIDYSPYNPPVRLLAAEKKESQEDGATNAIAVATLLTRQVITPTISRYVFRLTPTKSGKGEEKENGNGLRPWFPGQHVTFDFSPELDYGYSHMRDDDPQSLNDDFVRTFTVSAPIDPKDVAQVESKVGDNGGVSATSELRVLRDGAEPELEIVARRHGSATALLANWNLRVALEIPVLGFGGVKDFRMPVADVERKTHNRESVFIAGGVGITPLLAQALGVLGTDDEGKDRLQVLWSLRAVDLPLAVDTFTRIDGLGPVTKLFVTGSLGDARDGRDMLNTVKALGARVVEKRMAKDDVLGTGKEGRRKFFCCTGPAMLKALLQWTEGEEVVYESFEY